MDKHPPLSCQVNIQQYMMIFTHTECQITELKSSVSVSERHVSIQTTLEGLEMLVDLNGGT